ncbi:hypothetical protein COMA2_120019 [Candidatus Nitrospira nitrificans]|uniref:Uncharacterized protein n=1 Tax=Candidatus Nitrospira nitrificans TaxID=1742973 RepID=A0A0S4L728_9BACT|nr:hypothetical protein COMA2_120019 [Candidatus Nitrospira nitrificans]
MNPSSIRELLGLSPVTADVRPSIDLQADVVPLTAHMKHVFDAEAAG